MLVYFFPIPHFSFKIVVDGVDVDCRWCEHEFIKGNISVSFYYSILYLNIGTPMTDGSICFLLFCIV